MPTSSGLCSAIRRLFTRARWMETDDCAIALSMASTLIICTLRRLSGPIIQCHALSSQGAGNCSLWQRLSFIFLWSSYTTALHLHNNAVSRMLRQPVLEPNSSQHSDTFLKINIYDDARRIVFCSADKRWDFEYDTIVFFSMQINTEKFNTIVFLTGIVVWRTRFWADLYKRMYHFVLCNKLI